MFLVVVSLFQSFTSLSLFVSNSANNNKVILSYLFECNSMPFGTRRAYYGKVRVSFSAA